MRTAQAELLILGASTRAAAASAVRAGFHPVCADRFGDADLRRIATIVAVNDDLHRTLDAIKALPPMPWIYTGSVENDPKFIAAVSERHPLLGNPPSVLKLVRDPFWLERTLQIHDLPALRVRPVRSLDVLVRAFGRSAEGGQATGERWLLKPTRSGGGYRIAVWTGQALPTSEQFYLQEQQLGTPMSALFIGRPDVAELIGVCEQQIGPAAGAPTEFGYAGSIGPIVVSDRTRELLQRLGDTLTREAQLRGLFGIDFILADDIPWLVELNPRYTASVEVLERALGRALLNETCHVPLAPSGTGARGKGPSATSVCDQSPLTPDRSPRGGEGKKTRAMLPRIVGKQFVYATKDLIAPSLDHLFEADGHTLKSPLIADVPASGSHIANGWPICTVFAEAKITEDCQMRLASRRHAVLAEMTKP